jgi:excisionase family DNA binding protein
MGTPTKLTASMMRNYPDLMDVQHIQKILNIGRTKTYKLLKDGKIRSLRIGAEYRIPKAYLLEYLNN